MSYFMRAVLTAVFFSAAPPVFSLTSASAESPHCLHGCPSGAHKNKKIIRKIYTLSNNPVTKFADWAAYVVTPETIGKTASRNYRADPALTPEETLEPADYNGAYKKLKIDRGHLVPLASFTGTPHWRDTNYLSNITPQKSALNRGPWAKLEGKVRDLARRFGAVYVMTGPLYEKKMQPLPSADEFHQAPSGYWKIAAIKIGKTLRLAAFVMNQKTPRKADYCVFTVTVREVEEKSGLNFFPALSQTLQDKIETAEIETAESALRAALGCGD